MRVPKRPTIIIIISSSSIASFSSFISGQGRSSSVKTMVISSLLEESLIHKNTYAHERWRTATNAALSDSRTIDRQTWEDHVCTTTVGTDTTASEHASYTSLFLVETALSVVCMHSQVDVFD